MRLPSQICGIALQSVKRNRPHYLGAYRRNKPTRNKPTRGTLTEHYCKSQAVARLIYKFFVCSLIPRVGFLRPLTNP